MIAAILTVLLPFLMSSAFASGLHELLSAFGVSGRKESEIDTATSNISDAVRAGMSIYDAIENTRKDSNLDHAHAIAAGSAAVALLAKESIDLGSDGKVISASSPAEALSPR